jgi:hypothetical protein
MALVTTFLGSQDACPISKQCAADRTCVGEINVPEHQPPPERRMNTLARLAGVSGSIVPSRISSCSAVRVSVSAARQPTDPVTLSATNRGVKRMHAR